jgi:hypothetical protein
MKYPRGGVKSRVNLLIGCYRETHRSRLGAGGIKETMHTVVEGYELGTVIAMKTSAPFLPSLKDNFDQKQVTGEC